MVVTSSTPVSELFVPLRQPMGEKIGTHVYKAGHF
jgi:hypothetical protein